MSIVEIFSNFTLEQASLRRVPAVMDAESADCNSHAQLPDRTGKGEGRTVVLLPLCCTFWCTSAVLSRELFGVFSGALPCLLSGVLALQTLLYGLAWAEWVSHPAIKVAPCH